MTHSELKAYAIEHVRDVKQGYLQDLEAMSHDQLGTSPGGTARTAYDFTYEVALVNRRIAARIAGREPEPWAFEGWVTAPEEFRDRTKAIDNFSASVDALIEALESIPEEELSREIATSGGSSTPFKLANFAAYHIGYHDAQLNLLQSLSGDDRMHWQD